MGRSMKGFWKHTSTHHNWKRMVNESRVRIRRLNQFPTERIFSLIDFLICFGFTVGSELHGVRLTLTGLCYEGISHRQERRKAWGRLGERGAMNQLPGSRGASAAPLVTRSQHTGGAVTVRRRGHWCRPISQSEDSMAGWLTNQRPGARVKKLTYRPCLRDAAEQCSQTDLEQTHLQIIIAFSFYSRAFRSQCIKRKDFR